MIEIGLVAAVVLLVVLHFRMTSLQTEIQLLRAESLKKAPLTLEEEEGVATRVISPSAVAQLPKKA